MKWCYSSTIQSIDLAEARTALPLFCDDIEHPSRNKINYWIAATKLSAQARWEIHMETKATLDAWTVERNSWQQSILGLTWGSTRLSTVFNFGVEITCRIPTIETNCLHKPWRKCRIPSFPVDKLSKTQGAAPTKLVSRGDIPKCAI